jgi:hypothetical protein
MEATGLHTNNPATFVSIKFIVTARHLEVATVGVWIDGRKATKTAIIKELRDMLLSGGLDGASDWNHPDAAESYIKKATEHAKELFPTFYKS